MATDEDDFFTSPTPKTPSPNEESIDPVLAAASAPVTEAVISPSVSNSVSNNLSQSQSTLSQSSYINQTNNQQGPSTSITNLVSSDKTSRINLQGQDQNNFNFSDYATIHICETERRVDQTNSINSSTYITYLVEVRPKKAEDLDASKGLKGPNPILYSSLWRRFSEFDQLRDFLTVTYPHIIVPVVPCKTVARFQKGLKSAILHGHKAAHRDQLESPMAADDPLLLETRKIELERFLKAITEHDELKFSEIFWSFLQDKNEFLYKLKATGYNARLSALGLLIDQTANQAQKLTEGVAMQDRGRLRAWIYSTNVFYCLHTLGSSVCKQHF